MAFPGATPSYAGFTAGHTLAQDSHAAQSNAEQADIIALSNKLGTGASTPTSGLLLRGNGIGTSAWGQVILTSDVSGVLPQANGGTGTTLATGTGKAVYDTSPTISTPTISGGTISSPTITTPTIASFINATHNHESNTGGGTLNAANALQAGSINFANLLSSIFSSQIATSTNGGSAGGDTNFLNLGGLKICWGLTASISLSSSAQTTAVVNFPTTFAAAPKVLIATHVPTTTAFLIAQINADPTTSAVTLAVTSTTGASTTGSSKIDWIAIGI